MMEDFCELLACPACAGTLAADWSCRACGARFDAPDGISNPRLPGDARTDAVRHFYDRAPFLSLDGDSSRAPACSPRSAG
jgi:uncharacterized protein YbaR (Trm112 family)